MDKAHKTGYLPWQRPSRDQKTNLKSFICSHSYTNSKNLVKIGPGDVDISSLTEIVKNKNEKQRHSISPPSAPGGLFNFLITFPWEQRQKLKLINHTTGS